MREGQPALVRREDYAPPPFWIDSVDLSFDLDPAKTRVLNRMHGGDDVYWKSERMKAADA